MEDYKKIGGSNVQAVEAELRIEYNSTSSITLGVRHLRDLVAYAIHHFATIRGIAFQALVDCGYVIDVTDEEK